MKKFFTSVLLVYCLTGHSQDRLLSKNDKFMINSIGISTTVYGFVNNDMSIRQKNITCICGIVFTALPYLFEKNNYARFEVNGSGINFKIKFDKKYKKCDKKLYKS
jgi:hypothetical protein